MSDEVEIPQAYVAVEVTKSLAQYEPLKVRVSIPVPCVNGPDDDEFRAALERTTNFAKGEALVAAEVPFTVNEAGEYVVSPKVAQAQPQAAPKPQAASGSAQGAGQRTGGSATYAPTPCPKCGSRMYDNSQSKKGQQPDYKCSQWKNEQFAQSDSSERNPGCTGAVWLDSKF